MLVSTVFVVCFVEREDFTSPEVLGRLYAKMSTAMPPLIFGGDADVCGSTDSGGIGIVNVAVRVETV